MRRRKPQYRQMSWSEFAGALLVVVYGALAFYVGMLYGDAVHKYEDQLKKKDYTDIGGLILGDPTTREVVKLPPGTVMVLPDSLPREFKQDATPESHDGRSSS